MKFLENIRANLKARFSFSGVLGPFNQALCLILLAILCVGGLLVWAVKENDRFLLAVLILIFLLFVAIAAVVYHWKFRRVTAVTAPAVEYKDNHRSLMLLNPPDAVYEPGYIRMVLRSLIVGLDENLVPDGRVIGKASEEKFEKYSDADKAKWQKQHKSIVEGTRARITKELAALGPENEEEKEQV